MTKRLYYDDPYVTEFEGQILRRLETPDGPAVVLKETYFYPESGGQPHDLGTINGMKVIRVIEGGEDGKGVLHVLARLPDSDVVKCHVDEVRRRDHLQQHNGQHILSAVFLKKAAAQTVSFHLGSSTSTIDLDRPVADPELISAVEYEANRTVRRGLPVRSHFVEREEAARLELRRDPAVEGTLRIVEIEGFDRQACCGTHPRSTAEVGLIFIRGVERFKGNVRVEFVCGDRALHDYKTSIQRVRSLAQVLSSPEPDLVDSATRLVEEKKELTKLLQTFREEALRKQTTEWAANAEPQGDFKLVVLTVPDVTPAELRRSAVYLTAEPARVALLGARAEERVHLVFGRSVDVEGLDMAAILRKAVPMVEGRGGGSAQIAQGGGPRLDGLEEALETARRTVIESSK